MATSGSFKKTARQARNITVEDFFDKGIYMTDAALDTGLCANLVNYRIEATTGRLRPRGGFCPKDDTRVITEPVSETSSYYAVRSDLLINDRDEVHNISTLVTLNNTEKYVVPGIGGINNYQTTALDTFVLLDTDDHLKLKKFKKLHTPTHAGHAPSYDNFEPNITFSLGPTEGVHIIKDLPPFKVLPEQLGCVLLNNFIGLNKQPAGSTTPSSLYKYTVKTEQLLGGYEDFVLQENIEPRLIDPAFAVNYGYNMLLTDAYQFSNITGTGASTVFLQLGMLPFDPRSGHLTTDYRTGRKIKFKLYYNYSGSLSGVTLSYEYRLTSSDAWHSVPASRIISTGADAPGCYIYIPDTAFQIKVTATVSDTVHSMEIYSFSGGTSDDTVTKIQELPNYDLTSAQGMFAWKRRIGLYGVTNAPNIIFLSDIDDPSYFPYPNNIIEYDYPVLKVINFLDDIMVFTTDGIYQTELGPDGNSYITKQTVGNIHLTPSDVYSVQTIKNMLFYKADNRYYMLVPSTKYTTLNQLQVAPVSTPINYLLDNFEKEFRKMLQAMYGDWFNYETQQFDVFTNSEGITSIITPTYYSSFVDGDLVKLNFGFRIESPITPESHIIYSLIYDTLHQIWFSDIIELSEHEIFNLYRKSILGTAQYLLTNNIQMVAADEEDAVQEGYKLTVAVLQESRDTALDYTYLNNRHFPNRQYLDTGFRNINATWKKRFREIQFKLSTQTNKAIYLNPKFRIDNELRNDGNQYYLIFDAPVYRLRAKEDYIVKYGESYLEENEELPNTDTDYLPGAESDLYFKLGNELLTDASVSVLRFKTTGKGRCPRIQLSVHTDALYELHSVAWVFRNMNAR